MCGRICGKFVRSHVEFLSVAGQVGKCRCGKLGGQCRLGPRPGDVHGTRVLPFTGAAAQHALLEFDGTFSRLDHLEQCDVGGGASQGIATGGTGHGFEQAVLDEIGEDLREVPGRDIHLARNLPSFPSIAFMPGEIEYRSHRVVALPSERGLHFL